MDESLSLVVDYLDNIPNAYDEVKKKQLLVYFNCSKIISKGNEVYLVVLNALVRNQLNKIFGLIEEAFREISQNEKLSLSIQVNKGFSFNEKIENKQKKNYSSLSDNSSKASTSNTKSEFDESNNRTLSNSHLNNEYYANSNNHSSNNNGSFVNNNDHFNNHYSFSAHENSNNQGQFINESFGGNGYFGANQNNNLNNVRYTNNDSEEIITISSKSTLIAPPEMNISNGGISPSMYVSEFNSNQNHHDLGSVSSAFYVNNATHKLTLEELKKNIFYKPNSYAKSKTFDNFIEGPSNRIIYENCKEIARNPGESNLNPYLVCGEPGLGKTHILSAIANSISGEKKQIKLMYVSLLQLYQDFVSAITDRKEKKNSNSSLLKDFKNLYRSLDVLLIDDIQELEKVPAISDEFIALMNDLNSNQQLVFASSKHPSEMQNIIPKLRDRLSSGVIMKIEPPDVDTRRRIIQQKAKEVKLRLDKSSIEFITLSFKTNIRKLEGYIKTIAANVGNRKDIVVDVNFVKSILSDDIHKNAKMATLDNIKQTVAEYFKLTTNDLDSKTRARNVVHPRMIAMYFCRELTRESFPRIGKEFGGRDHTTVMNAVKKIKLLKEKDVSIREACDNLKIRFTN